MVIDTTPTATDFKIIPRDYENETDHNFYMTNEDTGAVQNFDQTPTKANGYFTYDISSGTFVEGQRYSVKIECSVSDGILWRGNVFVTNQTTQNYSIYG